MKSSPNGHTNGYKQVDETPAADRAVVGSPAVAPAKPESPMRFVAPSATGIDILKLLAELEEIVEKAPKTMGMMFRFDEDRFHMTLMKIRANLPEEMKRASKLVRDSEKLIEETQETAGKVLTEARKEAQAEIDRARSEGQKLRDLAQTEALREREALSREAKQIGLESRSAADQTVAEARAEAERLVAQNDIVRAAEALAADIRKRAEAEAAATRRGANDYAASVLATIQQTLSKAGAEIDRGREVLEKRK